MARQEERKPDSPNLVRRLGLVTGLIAVLTAGAVALVQFRDSISWLTSIAKIEVLPSQVTLDAGDKIQLEGAVKDAGGSLLDKPLVWTTADPAVAQVDGNGNIAARGAGEAAVTATVGIHRGSATILVRHAAVAKLEVFPLTASIKVGEHLKLDAMPYDSDGNPLPGRSVRWTSGDPQVATIDPASGEAVARGIGTVRFTVISESQKNSVTVDVRGKPPAITTSATFRKITTAENITLVNGASVGTCPAKVRIMIGERLVEVHSDREEVPQMTLGTAEYSLHGIVSCAGQSVAAVRGKGTVTIFGGKKYRFAWQRSGPFSYEIVLIQAS